MSKVEEKLRDIEKRLCSNFKGYLVDGTCQYAPTGESFITYCSSGSKPEGKPTKTYFTAEKAVDEFETTVRDIIKINSWRVGSLCLRVAKGRTLYWRKRPEIRNNGNKDFYVMSRFLISDKPLDPDVLEKYYPDKGIH